MVGFNLVDTYFVGQLGTNELAAMGFTFPIVSVIFSIAVGIGIGVSAVVSKAIGEGDQTQVKRLTTDSLVLSLLVVAFFLALGFLTMEPIFRLLGATDELLPLVRTYMTIWYSGMIFVVIPMSGNAAIRATGDTQTPSMVMIAAFLLNLILDPIFIFGWGPIPRMELAGAAYATVFSRFLTTAIALWVLHFREGMISFEYPKLSEIWQSWRQVLFIGMPAAGANIILPIGVAIITRMVAQFGAAAVAAFAVAQRVDGLVLAVLMALATVLAPVIGQNLGAGKQDRVRESIRLSSMFALAWGVGMAVILALAARPIATIFNPDPAVIETVTLYLWIAPIGYGFYGIIRLSNAALNVLNRPLLASGLMLTQMFVFLIPLTFLGSALFGIGGVFGATPIAYILAGGLCYWSVQRVLGQLAPKQSPILSPA